MILSGEGSAEQADRAASELIRMARRAEAAGIRKDRVLFRFESLFEEISDDLQRVRTVADAEAYKNIYAGLYAFASDMMRDTYMPLYLFILYRYANAVLETGEAETAAGLFRELCAGTDRLIGSSNTYMIHCLERYTVASARAGRTQKAQEAMEKMYRIAVDEFGPSSAMMMAVRKFRSEIRAKYRGEPA